MQEGFTHFFVHIMIAFQLISVARELKIDYQGLPTLVEQAFFKGLTKRRFIKTKI